MKPIIWFHIVLAVLACVTNTAFIITVGSKRQLQSTTNLILLSMAVADLFVGLLVTPIVGIFTHYTIIIDTAYVCACVHSGVLYFVIVSLHHVVLVAVERYLSVVYPLRYPVILTHSVLKKCISACWIVPLILTVSPAFGWYEPFPDLPNQGNTSDNTTGVQFQTRCEVEHITSCNYTYVISALVLAVFLIITYFHLRILFVACRQVRKHYTRTGRNKHSSTWENFRKEGRTFFMVMFVVDYFLLSWSPVGALVFLGCVVDQASIPKWMFEIFPLMAMANSALNPVIYGLAKRDIRQHVCRRLFGRRDKTKIYELSSSGYSRRQPTSSAVSSDG